MHDGKQRLSESFEWIAASLAFCYDTERECRGVGRTLIMLTFGTQSVSKLNGEDPGKAFCIV